MGLIKALGDRCNRVSSYLELKCLALDQFCYAIYLWFRQYLAKKSITEFLKRNFYFDLVVWMDFLLRIEEKDAKRHMIFLAVTGPWIFGSIFKMYYKMNSYPPELILYYVCWGLILLYDVLDFLMFSNEYVTWRSQSSLDYQKLILAYEKLKTSHTTLQKSMVLTRKEVYYFQQLLKSEGRSLEVYTARTEDDDIAAGLVQIDQGIKKSIETNQEENCQEVENHRQEENQQEEENPQEEEKEQDEFPQEEENQRQDENPQKDENHQKEENPQEKDENQTNENKATKKDEGKLSTNSNGVAEIEQNAKQDFKEGEWEIVDGNME